jgi:predicted transcriptional regulator
MSLQGAARLLSQAHVSGAPVVDEEGRCVGVLSATDFLHIAEKGKNATVGFEYRRDNVCSWQIVEASQQVDRLVKHFMTPDPVMVALAVNIGELSRMMLEGHIHRVIVTDADCKPLGIVSSMDILSAVARAYSVYRTGPEFNHGDDVPQSTLLNTEYVG